MPSHVYETVGLLSCCPAYFDAPIEKLVSSLPLSEEVQQALLGGEGPLGLVLESAQLLQEAKWDQLSWGKLEEIGLTATKVSAVFRETLAWDNNSREVDMW